MGPFGTIRTSLKEFLYITLPIGKDIWQRRQIPVILRVLYWKYTQKKSLFHLSLAREIEF